METSQQSPDEQSTRERLSPETEAGLARRVEAGVYAEHLLSSRQAGRGHGRDADELRMLAADGQHAASRILLAHTGLVDFIAWKEAGRSGRCRDDLFQEGCLGLIEGLHRFDWRRGVRFAAFAGHWIRYRMNLVSERGAPRAGVAKQQWRDRVVRRAADELEQQLGRTPTTAEVGRLLGRRPRSVDRALSPPVQVSLHAGDAEVAEIPDDRWDPQALLFEGQTDELATLVLELPPVERRVIEARYGLARSGGPRAGSTAAGELGMSVSTLRRVERAALRRLRGGLRALEAA